MDEVYGMSDLNDLIERLILDEYERRHGKILLDDTHAPSALVLNEEAIAVPKQKKKVA